MTATAALDLSPGQVEAIEKITDWYRSATAGNGPQVFRLFGPAGTGKTTIARLVPEAVGAETYHFGAFSGKAVAVLAGKGCRPAGTLHSLMYAGPINLRQQLRELRKAYEDERTPPAVAAGLRGRIRALEEEIASGGHLRFQLADDPPLKDADLVIADEVSMVPEAMADDLLSFDIPVLVLGDPFQLPPVRGEGSLTRQEPDHLLTEVHRQALESPVLQLATAVRLGEGMPPSVYGMPQPWHSFDQVLTWRRRTRWSAVRALRERLGRPPGVPVEGDRVMCLANNKALKVFNGQTWYVRGVEGRDAGTVLLHLVDDGSETDPEAPVHTIPAHLAAFSERDERSAEESRLGSGEDLSMLATFAQALTVHKAQGSEWGSVLIMDETASMWRMTANRRGPEEASEQTRRWLYTALTRARDVVGLVRR